MLKRQLRYLIGILTLFFAGVAPADDLPVIVMNTMTSPTPALSKSALNAIFGMRLRRWEDGSPVKVYVLPDDHPLHVAFSKQVLRVFPYQLRNAWDRLVFSGTGEEPVRMASEQQMRNVVGTTPGAIGYLSPSMVDETVKAIFLK
jgi:ABC-type phosphate transport system substrate-binding protein